MFFGRGRAPFLLPVVILLAIVGFGLLGPAGAALGFVLFLPLKLFFLMFLFGMIFRFRSPWGRGRQSGPWGPPREPTEEERERAEAHRQAKEEVDSLFPDL